MLTYLSKFALKNGRNPHRSLKSFNFFSSSSKSKFPRRKPKSASVQSWSFESLDRNNTFFREFRKQYNIDDFRLFETFKESSFLKFANETQRLLPFIFDIKLLLKVIFFYFL